MRVIINISTIIILVLSVRKFFNEVFLCLNKNCRKCKRKRLYKQTYKSKKRKHSKKCQNQPLPKRPSIQKPLENWRAKKQKKKEPPNKRRNSKKRKKEERLSKKPHASVVLNARLSMKRSSNFSAAKLPELFSYSRCFSCPPLLCS